MKKILLVVSLSMVFLSACGGSSGNGGAGLGGADGLGGGGTAGNSVSANGVCSKSFEDDVVAIYTAYQTAEANQTLDNVKLVKAKCDNFRHDHAKTVVCKLTNLQNGQVNAQPTKASDIYDECQEVDTAVANGHFDAN